ncbi:MAG: metal-sulfur cluster assembly factor [Chloroflexi bacterium]|nr:metal-sulfur cluster assembly factor [Chloroflexota bacterium]
MAETRYVDRIDSVDAKVEALARARANGDHAIALALADSIKDGVRAEVAFASATPSDRDSDAHADWSPVSALPSQWHEWVAGWTHFRIVTVTEPQGLLRDHEPVDIEVVVPVPRSGSLARELRVARLVDTASGTSLGRVVSQVYGETRTRGPHPVRRAHLAWSVNLDASEQASFVILVGNPAAELPRDVTDLTVSGEGSALEIGNAHHVASLSAQMGQLERLRYRRGHGLELFAGGEGHGEPPHIDWAHDYLASDRFQKFRVTNWDACPNMEVIRGPVVTIVRRWGFPHSPLHPMFPASRMFVEVRYLFYAGVPYFLKDGRMEATRDFTLNYLRDDEWVFSGYAFTDQVWVDEDGVAHEGAVPPDHADRMWGVGFFHRDSQDAFVSLRLQHHLESAIPGSDLRQTVPAMRHADAPALHYPGHGQLWSRWALRDDPELLAGDRLVQRNAYLTAPYPPGDGASQLGDWVRRFRNPVVVSVQPSHDAGTVSTSTLLSGVIGTEATVPPGRLAMAGEEASCAVLKQAIWDALRDVRDDMFYTVNANLHGMGYVYDLRMPDGLASGRVEMTFTMPHRGRPMYRYLANPAVARLKQVPGVRGVTVAPVWDPPWTPDRMDDDAWQAMDFPVMPSGPHV